jgi:hypothetical protein
MSIDPKLGRYCDGCGRLMKAAHKLHLGNEYCGSCYKRLFKAAQCVLCAGKTIAHKNDMEPVCSPCKTAARTCLRCDKPVPRAGLLIDDRAVCPSCVPYFKGPEKCSRCERVTPRLSTMPSAGVFEKICDSCRNRHTHGTCSLCRKYRKVGGSTDDAAPICTECVSNKGTTHACPGCGVDVPGKGASRCRACLNQATIEQEVRLTASVFTHDWAAVLWSRFANWMYRRSPGNPKVLSTVRFHQPFFERIDVAFESALDLTGSAVLQLFGTPLLRRHFLAAQFLAEQLDVHVPSLAKSEASELDRINETLIAAKRTPWGELIHAYHQALTTGTTAPRTIRMYLSSAAAFCAHASVDTQPWNAGVLEQYLSQKPGARNNLARFVSFCKQSRGWDVQLPSKGRAVPPLTDPVRSARALRDLIKTVEAMGLHSAPADLLGSILSVALGLSKSAILSSAADFQVAKDAVIYCHGAERIHMPDELEPYARRFAEIANE